MIGRLHVITDEVLQDRFDHEALARLALEGGADGIQYREKRPVPDRERLRVARVLAELCAAHDACLVIDDRADLAALVGAGVHVGPHDLPVADARALVPGTVGATANDLDRAMVVAAESPSYLGCGPVWGTTSKGADPPPTLGLDGLAAICAAVDLPVIAIGSVRADRVAAALGAGAHGVAVLGAVCSAKDPAAATARIREAIVASIAEGSP